MHKHTPLSFSTYQVDDEHKDLYQQFCDRIFYFAGTYDKEVSLNILAHIHAYARMHAHIHTRSLTHTLVHLHTRSLA